MKIQNDSTNPQHSNYLGKLIWQIYDSLYKYLRHGALRFMIKPLLWIKVEEHSLGYHINRAIRGFISKSLFKFSFRNENIIHLKFGPILFIPAGYPEAYRFGGSYEPETTRLISNLLKPGNTFVDVGAHLGYYTLLAKMKVGDAGRVFAFEPDPRYFQAIMRSLELNGIREGVYVYQMAVSDKISSLTFFTDNAGGLGNLFVPIIGGRSITVDAVSLDEFFCKLGWPQIDLIKIDVEGAEEEVFIGMKELSHRNKSLRLIVEFSAKRRLGRDPHDFFTLLQQIGTCRVFAIEKPQLHSAEEIIKYWERMGHLNLFCEIIY